MAAAPCRPRVLIVTASMGAGHTQIAVELARRLSARECEVAVVDALELAGPAGARLRRTYRTVLSYAPALYDGAMRTWLHHPAAGERLFGRPAHAFEAPLAAQLTARQPDAVVVTYNLAAQAVSRLVARHEWPGPLVTLVTDPGPHPYWVTPAAALQIAPLPGTARALAAFGAPDVVVAPPVLRPQVWAAAARRPPRSHRRTVLVTGGSWAAGGVRRTVATLRRVSSAEVVVLCGRDDRLRAELSGDPRVHAVGWTRDAPGYLAAADVVVDNAGGLTCHEALACGTPVVLYDVLAGHGRLNAAALVEAGLVGWARTADELGAAVAVPPPVPAPEEGTPAEQYVLDVLARTTAPALMPGSRR